MCTRLSSPQEARMLLLVGLNRTQLMSASCASLTSAASEKEPEEDGDASGSSAKRRSVLSPLPVAKRGTAGVREDEVMEEG